MNHPNNIIIKKNYKSPLFGFTDEKSVEELKNSTIRIQNIFSHDLEWMLLCEKEKYTSIRDQLFMERFMTNDEMIELCKEYAEDHPTFSLDFVESLEDAISEYGDLTDSQRTALENIVARFHIVKYLKNKRIKLYDHPDPPEGTNCSFDPKLGF